MEKTGKAYLATAAVYLALSFTLAVFTGIVVIMSRFGIKPLIPDFEKTGALRYLFYMLSLSMIFSIRFVKNALFKKDGPPEKIIQRLQVGYIICGALNESAALTGFILFLFSGNKLDFYILLALSLFSVSANFPTKNKWREHLTVSPETGN